MTSPFHPSTNHCNPNHSNPSRSRKDRSIELQRREFRRAVAMQPPAPLPAFGTARDESDTARAAWTQSNSRTKNNAITSSRQTVKKSLLLALSIHFGLKDSLKDLMVHPTSTTSPTLEKLPLHSSLLNGPPMSIRSLRIRRICCFFASTRRQSSTREISEPHPRHLKLPHSIESKMLSASRLRQRGSNRPSLANRFKQ